MSDDNLLMNEIGDIDSDEDKAKSIGTKLSYKDRKIEGKLKKYEQMLKNVEDINRCSECSKFLFIGNCGLDNNISREYIENKFEKYGTLIDVIMQNKKSYSFVIYEKEESTKLAIDDLQGKTIDCECASQTPICFYLLPVDKVPSLYRLDDKALPNGLICIDNFIDDNFAKDIVNFINNDNREFADLNNRRVKHYGYEFRYGTNDVDQTKPLEAKIPDICEKLIDKCIETKLIDSRPDQLTVNLYEPGQGIPPHVDNPIAFGDYILSLSLLSDVVMEFRLKEEKIKKFSSKCLKANSLLIMKSDARYKWTHSIAERKHDLIINYDSKLTLIKRDIRMSLTFRKIVTDLPTSKQENSVASDDKIKLPETEQEASQFESSYVHKIYNEIAEHFSNTRHSAWPGVANFINALPKYSYMLDIGCGNGKYLNLRNDIFAFGCDYSTELVNICQQRGFNCFTSDCLRLACRDNLFDCALCIAVIHHLSTKERRIRAINEMLRILNVGGKGLITVWAKEQKLNDKESYYIKKSKSKKKQAETLRVESTEMTNQDESIERENEENKSYLKKPDTHEYGKPFEKQDVFVTWHYRKMNEKKQQKKEELEEKHENENNEQNNNINDNVYLRFYHVFQNGELESLFENIENVKVISSFYEQGNWCVIFEKTK